MKWPARAPTDDRPRDRAPRLAYLDGLRGMAALAVMSQHVLASDLLGSRFGPVDLHGLEWVLWPLTQGMAMVYLFIALSGFGLCHGELARRERGAPTPFWVYLRRRAWRILPVYYVAIAVSLLAQYGASAMAARGWGCAIVEAPLTRNGVLAHLLLAHDYYQPWLDQVEPPLWSIAVEWQLYFCFPLAIAALVRWPALVVALVPLALVQAHDAAHLGYPNAASLLLAHIGLWFVAGMAAAKLARDGVLVRASVLIGLGATGLALGLAFGQRVFIQLPAVQAVWAAGVLCLLLGLYRAPAAWWNVPTWPVFREVGRWSYSLYAIHYPVLMLAFVPLSKLGLSPMAHQWVSLGVVGLLSCLAARLLFKWVEQPSIARMAAPARSR